MRKPIIAGNWKMFKTRDEALEFIYQVNNDLPFIISASALKEWQESTSLNSTLSMVNPLSLGNTLNTQEIDLQPIESDIQPLEINEEIEPIEVDNIEPLEEEENEES